MNMMKMIMIAVEVLLREMINRKMLASFLRLLRSTHCPTKESITCYSIQSIVDTVCERIRKRVNGIMVHDSVISEDLKRNK